MTDKPRDTPERRQTSDHVASLVGCTRGRSLSKRLILLAVFSIGLLTPASALAAAKKFTITSKAGVLNTGANLNLLGGVTEGTFGEGALVLHNKLITASTGRSTYTLFTKTGSFSGAAKLTGKTSGHGASGKTLLTGTATITTGTGAFTGATGKFRISGVSPSSLPYFLLKFNGSLTLP